MWAQRVKGDHDRHYYVSQQQQQQEGLRDMAGTPSGLALTWGRLLFSAWLYRDRHGFLLRHCLVRGEYSFGLDAAPPCQRHAYGDQSMVA